MSKKKQKSDYKPLHEKKTKKREMNAGGYYEGMPGAVLDEWGNRKMISFITKEDGRSTAIIEAHPKFCKQCIQQSLTNPMTKGIVYSAVMDDLFSNKNPLNWILKLRFRIIRTLEHYKAKRKATKRLKQSIKDGQA